MLSFKLNIPLFYLFYFASAFLLSALINSIFLSFSTNLGIRKSQNVQIRWNPSAKPALGGISFFVIFLLSIAFLGITNLIIPVKINDAKSLGVLVSITIAFVMGLADDAFDTKPLLKFSTQFFCALILILTNNKISCFQSEFLNYFMTVFWIIGIMNSVNMLDNMDGITSIVAIIILAFVCVLSIYFGNPLSFISISSVALLGAVSGFLLYNWNPSKLFMGDAGSQFLGLFLGILAIEYFWNFDFFSTKIPAFYLDPRINFLAVVLVFTVPLADTLSVVINRIRNGKSPFIGGKDHSTHSFFRLGMSEKKIAIVYASICLISCSLVFFVLKSINNSTTNYFYFLLFPIAVFVIFFYVTYKNVNEK